uniref:Sulfotransferase domain-containing protein n=1 Tax=Calcidiscus leptoporus TaxID=127549 RepID=A0A7S0J4Z1_9EUKA|mmetsp:Transcript_39808/g.93019  ORF Transcript_39808/g.93019 Transcript_39808/m.93019 type:complete len:290 (+) Transcript_39808:105-974(+)
MRDVGYTGIPPLSPPSSPYPCPPPSASWKYRLGNTALKIPNASVPDLVIIVSTQRGASTETAETIGSHPCAASFNELLVHSQFPTGYARYRKGSYARYLNVSKLRHDSWLSDALAVREGFCKSRPKVLLDACGDVCVVVLKMHLNNFISSATDTPWLALVTSEHTRAIIVEREGLQNYCSILSAKTTHDWGHTPDAHNQTLSSGRPCEKTKASERFVKNVQQRFFSTRSSLQRANRSWLELPFAEYIADPTAAAERMLSFIGLQRPPPKWRSICALPWCAAYRWPNAER